MAMYKLVLLMLLCGVPLVSSAEEISLGKRAWDECFKDSQNDSNYNLGVCMGNRAGGMKEKLKQEYEILRAQAHKNDLALKSPFNVLESKLLESQNMFFSYMEKQCGEDGLVGARYATGTGVGEGISKCEIDLISQRLIVLNTEY
jgi:hypothetical protein